MKLIACVCIEKWKRENKTENVEKGVKEGFWLKTKVFRKIIDLLPAASGDGLF